MGHGDADDDDDRLDKVMRRVVGPGTRNLDGETEKTRGETDETVTCSETQHTQRTADDNMPQCNAVRTKGAQKTRVGLSRFFAFL